MLGQGSQSDIGVPDNVAAGGREGIFPENAIAKAEEKGREAALGPQIYWLLDFLNRFRAIQRVICPENIFDLP